MNATREKIANSAEEKRLNNMQVYETFKISCIQLFIEKY